jgi:hypothetical protein
LQENAVANGIFSQRKSALPRTAERKNCEDKSLFAFVAVAAGALISRAIASIAHVDGAQGTVRTRVVMTAARHVTTNAFVYRSFDHKNYLLTNRLKVVLPILAYFIDI